MSTLTFPPHRGRAKQIHLGEACILSIKGWCLWFSLSGFVSLEPPTYPQERQLEPQQAKRLSWSWWNPSGSPPPSVCLCSQNQTLLGSRCCCCCSGCCCCSRSHCLPALIITIFKIIFSLFIGYVQLLAFSHLVERHEHEGHQVVGVEAKLASASRARGPL